MAETNHQRCIDISNLESPVTFHVTSESFGAACAGPRAAASWMPGPRPPPLWIHHQQIVASLTGLELRNHFDLNFKLSRPGRPEWTWTWIIMVGTGVARLTEEIHGPVDSVGWIQERGLRQRSIGPTSWWQLLECGRPNMRWQGWSGSVIHPLAAKIRLSTVYTVRIKPAIYQNACNCM